MPSTMGQLLRAGTRLAPVVAPLISGLTNRGAINSSVNNLTQGVNQAQGALSQNRQDISQILGPYLNVGQPALNQLSTGTAPGGDLIKPFEFNQDQFWNDPQIQRRIAEGNKLLARRQASTSSLNSGAALKAARDYNDYQIGNEFNTEYNRQQGTFRANQATALDALLKQIGIGQQAATSQTAADTLNTQQLIDLIGEASSARATGDIERANNITDMISGITSGITGIEDFDQLMKAIQGPGTTIPSPPVGSPDFVGPVQNAASSTAPGVASAVGGAAGTLAAAAPGAASLAGATPSLAAIAGGVVPELPTAALTSGLSVPSAVAPASSSGGLGSAAISLLQNPWTIAVGAGILGVTALLKSQAHHEANTWVSGFQKPFDQRMDQLNREFVQSAQSGQMTRDQALAARQEAQGLIDAYKAKLAKFSQQGSDERTVARQAQQTADQQYGPNFSKWLGYWDSLIQGLA